MKSPFQEAAELFRQSESCILDNRPDEERACFCRALALLAEGFHRLDCRIEQLEGSTEGERKIVKTFPRRIRQAVFNRNGITSPR